MVRSSNFCISSTVWFLLDGWSLNTAACVAVDEGQDPLSYSPLIRILQKKCVLQLVGSKLKCTYTKDSIMFAAVHTALSIHK